MKCKKCSYEWQSFGESLTCPGCGTRATLTSSEKQTLWEEAYEAEKIKDHTLGAKCYFALAEMGDEKAQYAYGECLRRGIGVPASIDNAILWYKAAARRRYPAAAYRLAKCLSESKNYGDSAGRVFFWLRVAAEFGETDAAIELSRAYEDGEGVEPSHRHALFWLMRAAEYGNNEARVALAKMYYEGNGVGQDLAAARYFMKDVPIVGFRMRRFARRLGSGECDAPAEITILAREEERLALARQAESDGEYAIASHLYFFAARGGSLEATYRLGRLYEEGQGVPKSPEEARRRYGVAAKAGNADAILRLGVLCAEGRGGAVDVDTAIECFTRLAEQGDAEGAFRLGEIYREGKLVASDLLSAIRYYKSAMERGHEGARRAMEEINTVAGRIYEKASRLEKRGDPDGARDAYRAAALMGHAGAAYAIGLILEQIAKKPEERKEVFTFYRTAAEGGHVGGVYHLALCYSRGYGTARDYETATRLLTVAAKQKHTEAEEELNAIKLAKYRRVARRFYSISSVLYRKGELNEAIKFRNIAAKLGSARAMYMLGCHFEFGDGLPADRVKANAWYSRAIAAGYDPSHGDLKGGFLRERKKLIVAKRNQAN